MYRIIYILIPICLLMFSSCIDTITELEQGDFTQEVVIDALLLTEPEKSFVRVNYSVQLDEDIMLKPINNAQVYLSGSGNVSDTLLLTEPGYYTLPGLVGHTGTSYRLEVWVDGTVYRAQTMLLPVSEIDSLSCKYAYNKYIDSSYYHVRLYAPRVSETYDSYYLLKTWRNDTILPNFNAINVFSDNTIRGLNGILFPNNYKEGDTLRVGLYSLDEAAFNYYSDIFNLQVNNLNTIYQYPLNPPGNISNGALGIFRASDVSYSEVVIE